MTITKVKMVVGDSTSTYADASLQLPLGKTFKQVAETHEVPRAKEIESRQRKRELLGPRKSRW